MKRSFLWKLLQAFCRIATTLLFDLKVHGKHHVPASGGVLVLANHQSYLDPILIAVQLRRPVSFMARSGLFTNRYFGWLIRNLHAFPVRQGEGDVGAIRETVRRLQDGHVLNIYPEGSRTEDGELQRIEPGAALVVRKAGVPIVPAVIDGSFQAWPKTKRMFRQYPIRVLYGPPMHLSHLKGNEIVKVIDETFHRMFSELRAMHPELQRKREAADPKTGGSR